MHLFPLVRTLITSGRHSLPVPAKRRPRRPASRRRRHEAVVAAEQRPSIAGPLTHGKARRLQILGRRAGFPLNTETPPKQRRRALRASAYVGSQSSGRGRFGLIVSGEHRAADPVTLATRRKTSPAKSGMSKPSTSSIAPRGPPHRPPGRESRPPAWRGCANIAGFTIDRKGLPVAALNSAKRACNTRPRRSDRPRPGCAI